MLVDWWRLPSLVVRATGRCCGPHISSESELCLGTTIFGGEGSSSTPAEIAKATIAQCVDAGGSFIDTANVYTGGRSEEIVGQALKGLRKHVILATQVHFRTGEGANDIGLPLGPSTWSRASARTATMAQYRSERSQVVGSRNGGLGNETEMRAGFLLGSGTGPAKHYLGVTARRGYLCA